MRENRCEECGNTDLIKRDGYYICRDCDREQTEEQIKKTTIKETDKIDNTEFFKKNLENEPENFTDGCLKSTKKTLSFGTKIIIGILIILLIFFVTLLILNSYYIF